MRQNIGLMVFNGADLVESKTLQTKLSWFL